MTVGLPTEPKGTYEPSNSVGAHRVDADVAERELQRLRSLAWSARHGRPGYEVSPLEAPYTGAHALRTAARDLNGGSWLALMEGLPFVEVLDQLEGVLSWALQAFEAFRFPGLPIDPGNGMELCMPAGTRQRLPPAVHREAIRLLRELQGPWGRPAIEGAPDRAALEASRIWPMHPLGDVHLASIAALVCLEDAVQTLADERARLHGRFRQQAPGIRFECSRYSADWLAAAAALQADDGCRRESLSACQAAMRRVEHACEWIKTARREAELRREAVALAAEAVATEQGMARLARQSAGARGARQLADAKRSHNRQRVLDAWQRLSPSQRGREAVGVICRALEAGGALNETAVRAHLVALGLRPGPGTK